MEAINKIELEELLVIDIETTTLVKQLELNTPLFDAWSYTNKKLNLTDIELLDLYHEKGALYPEFGRIACISVGTLHNGNFVTMTFNDENEKELIEKFNKTLRRKHWKVSGHFIKTFDIPYIFKRSIVNGVIPHKLVDVSGKKPWEIIWIVDTAELWGFTSLVAVTNALGIPSPKDDISGADVPKMYWDGEIERISRYCEKDVEAVYNILYRFKNISDVPAPLVEKPLLTAMFEGHFSEADNEILKTLFNDATKENAEKMSTILNAIVSTAKGKTTKLTKAHIKQLNS